MDSIGAAWAIRVGRSVVPLAAEGASKVLAFPGKLDRAWIEDRLESWCKAHSCWDVGENTISYGWRTIKMPPRRELMKRYNRAAAQKNRADERWRLLAAMLNPMIAGA